MDVKCTCIKCGQSFTGPRQSRYCPECRRERKAEQTREYRARKYNGESQILNSTVKCERCGQPFILTSGHRRFCDNCAPIHVNEAYRIKYAQTHSKTNKPKPKPYSFNNIRAYRIKADMSLDDLAKNINISSATLRSWELCNTTPADEYIVKIAAVLNTTPKELLR